MCEHPQDRWDCAQILSALASTADLLPSLPGARAWLVSPAQSSVLLSFSNRDLLDWSSTALGLFGASHVLP